MYKQIIVTKDNTSDVQRVLFDMGYKWVDDETDVFVTERHHDPYVLVLNMDTKRFHQHNLETRNETLETLDLSEVTID